MSYGLLTLMALVNGVLGVCHIKEGTTVDCSHSSLFRVPDNIPVNTTDLDMTYNNISILYNNDFLLLVNLRNLDLSLNPIMSIEVEAFNGLSSLVKLELFGHHLNYTEESLPIHVFKPLQSLSSLALRSDMKFHHLQIPDKSLESLTNLTELIPDTTPDIVFKSGFSKLTKLQRLIIGETIKLGNTFKCGISEISSKTFSVFSVISVKYLDFHGCILHQFDKDSLKPFPVLDTFLFTGVSFLTGNLSDVIDALTVYEHQNMSQISITHLYSNTKFTGPGCSLNLQILSKICVAYLDLSYNDITFIDFDVVFMPPFSPLTKCLKHFYLKSNGITGRASRIYFAFIGFLSNLETIDFSLQNIFGVNHFETLSRNQPLIERHPFGLLLFIPPRLKYLNIAGMPQMLGSLHDTYVFNGYNLQYLNLSYCGLYNFRHKVFGVENVKELDLSSNDLSILLVDFFDTFPNLTNLRLSHVLLDNDFITDHGKRIFAPLVKLEILDLSNNDLVFLPYDIFESMVTVRVISLVNNKLITIPDVSSLVNLHYIHLSYNSLTTIEKKYRQMLDKTSEINTNFHLSIFGNTFSCSCPEAKFLIWLIETNVNLDGRNYSCMDMNGLMTTTKTINNRLSYFHRTCSSAFWLNLATGGLFLICIAMVTAFVFIKNKMKVQLFLLRMIGQNVYPRKRDEFVYDTNIIYAGSSYKFVTTVLCPALETQRGLKLNISDRDHLGRFETSAICEAIRDSWKTVLILTDDFLNEDPTYFTLCSCLSAITLTTPDRLILVVDKATTIPDNVEVLLHAVAQHNIICVNFEEPLNDDFWIRISNIILTNT